MKYHVMWLVLFAMLGITIAEFLKNISFLVLFILLGFLVMLAFKKTPSESLGFTKTKKQSILVWFIVLTILVFMILNILNWNIIEFTFGFNITLPMEIYLIFGIWLIIDTIFSILTHFEENLYFHAGRAFRLLLGIMVILLYPFFPFLQLIGVVLIIDSIISVATHKEENFIQYLVRIIRLIIGIILLFGLGFYARFK